MSAAVPKTPFVLLGLLTILTVAGPLAISQSIQGGASPNWPPDRPVEWWIFGLCTGVFVAIMGACLAIGFANYRRTLARRPPPPVDDSFNSD